MRKKSWLRRNFPLLVMMVWAFWGAAMVGCIVPFASLLHGGEFKLLAMIIAGVAFGWVGLGLALIAERRSHRSSTKELGAKWRKKK